MFVNLHELPAGTDMYTAFISADAPGEDACYEELDFTAPNSVSPETLLSLATREAADLYDPEMVIVGLSNQSAGYWVYRAEGWL